MGFPFQNSSKKSKKEANFLQDFIFGLRIFFLSHQIGISIVLQVCEMILSHIPVPAQLAPKVLTSLSYRSLTVLASARDFSAYADEDSDQNLNLLLCCQHGLL